MTLEQLRSERCPGSWAISANSSIRMCCLATSSLLPAPSHPSPKGSHDFLSLFQFWVTCLRPMTSGGSYFFLGWKHSCPLRSLHPVVKVGFLSVLQPSWLGALRWNSAEPSRLHRLVLPGAHARGLPSHFTAEATEVPSGDETWLSVKWLGLTLPPTAHSDNLNLASFLMSALPRCSFLPV